MASSSRQEFSNLFRAGIDEGTQQRTEQGQNSDCGLYDTVQSCLQVVSYRYANTTVPLAYIEAELHDVWYACIQAAKHMSCSNYSQDALVRSVVAAKVMGHLRRPVAARGGSSGEGDGNSGDGSGDEIVHFSDGSVFWSDLPLFSADLVDEWASRYYVSEYYDEDQRVDLAAFAGRLLSVGIYQSPAACLLSLLRETLEVHRPLVSAAMDGCDSNERARTTLAVDDLLCALQQLVHHVEGGIFMLRYHCDPEHLQVPPGGEQLSSLGPLALESGYVVSGGYNTERWRFWTQRLRELAGCDVEGIAGNAEACLLGICCEEDGKVGSFSSASTSKN